MNSSFFLLIDISFRWLNLIKIFGFGLFQVIGVGNHIIENDFINTNLI